jgi:hypothetical protein
VKIQFGPIFDAASELGGDTNVGVNRDPAVAELHAVLMEQNAPTK